MLNEIKYIDGDNKKGIEYDWKLIDKTIKKLKLIPQNVYKPKLNIAKWEVLCSDRSTGKTTSWLLVGMVMHQLYGTRIHYIREDEDMLRPMNLKNMFDVIKDNNYISIITENKWNDVLYRGKRWYYIKRKENGEIEEQDTECFMFCMSIDNNVVYKSGYSCTTADLIIFDEFISKRYMRGDFTDFCDLLSTLIRQRLSAQIVLLANTIDKNSEYFDELNIREIVDTLPLNEEYLYKTDKGTSIYINFFSGTMTKQKKLVNTHYFGFNNSKLNSIIGGEWATDTFPHITDLENVEVMYNNFYVNYNNKFLQIEIALSNVGVVGLVHNTNNPLLKYDDCIVYTNMDIHYPQERYRFGSRTLDNFLWSLYKQNKFYYANNFVGSVLDKYVTISNRL